MLLQKAYSLQRAVCYFTWLLSMSEANYSTTEIECLDTIGATANFHPNLYGRPFRVVSNRHALCLANLKESSERLAQWSLRLQEFNIPDESTLPQQLVSCPR